MTYNPISMNRVFDSRDRSGVKLTTTTTQDTATGTSPGPVRTRWSLRTNLNRLAHDALVRSRAERQMRRELAARDDRLLRDIGLEREHTTIGDIAKSNGDRYPHGLHLSGLHRREGYRRL